MKPYIAILIDSFWEAVGNRVLWALLIGWSLVLLGLAPFGYISQRSYQLSSVDIDNRSQLIENLASGLKGQGNPSVQAVASRLEPEFIERLKKSSAEDESQGQRRISQSELAQALNFVVKSSDLFSDEAFPSAKRRPRLEPLIERAEQGSIDEAEREELNRELLQLAFPLVLNRPQGEQLWIGYAGFKLGEPLPVNRRQIKQFLEPLLLGFIIKLGLGILAVFVAIVVTSPIIPDTFRSGSLHLLLSKPISRVWLYLSKFFGGCIFVLVNITFVLIGLYFIAGFRFDIWNSGLLACIPILMFVFIIFYSVSALTGLVWGNAIVCVVACMIFWLFCFSIGFMHDALLPQAEVLPQISRIREIDGRVMTVDQRGVLAVWNAEYSIWQPALESDVRGQARTFGPMYLEDRNLILTKSFFRLPFGDLQARSRKLSMIRLDKGQQKPSDASAAIEESTAIDESTTSGTDMPSTVKSDAPKSLAETRETPVWLSDPGPELPAQLFDVVELGDSILAICRGGLFQLNLEKLEIAESSQKGFFGIKLPWASASAFDNIAPKDYFLSANSNAATTQSGDGLIVYSSGSLDHFVYDGEKLQSAGSSKLEGDGTEAAIVEMNHRFCVVARDNLPLEILDEQLKRLATVALPGDQQVRQLSWIPGTSDMAIITHTGNLFRLDCESQVLAPLLPSYQGQCTCMTWKSDKEVWLGTKPSSVVLVDLQTARPLQEFVPQATLLERIFRWGVKPVYLLNPKPAALDTAMGYALTGSQTSTLNIVTNDLEAAQLELDVWTPIISNLIFVAVILGFSCWYVSRKEY